MDLTALIKAAQSGDDMAFEQLLEMHYDDIYRIAFSWCGQKSDAEDITQNACMKLARNLGQYHFNAKFSTWLYRLVINCAKDWQRQQKDHTEELHEASFIQDSVAEIAIYLRQLLVWVELLGAEFKETVLLVFGEGLSHKEAADVLDVKESTVSWRIHKVRSKLHEFNPEPGGQP